MGGFGSGRRPHANLATTEDRLGLDVRWLQRNGCLLTLGKQTITWSMSGVEVGKAHLSSEHGWLNLSYRHQSSLGLWQAVDCTVRIETTPCHYGGHRVWFRCPSAHCGRRIAILYVGSKVECRYCARLAFASQRESLDDRIARRIERIRDRLKWVPGFLNGDGLKPTRMHQKTFQRLRDQHQLLVRQSLEDMRLRFFSISDDLDIEEMLDATCSN